MIRTVGLSATHSDHVIYVKHPKTRTFVVCALRKDFKVFSPNFRNTLTVASKEGGKGHLPALQRKWQGAGSAGPFPARGKRLLGFVLLQGPRHQLLGNRFAEPDIL